FWLMYSTNIIRKIFILIPIQPTLPKNSYNADSIRIAAMDKDMRKVLQHYRIMQKGCVGLSCCIPE
ncbi:MAG: hypothetical protein WD599_03270, partial [Balneolaceae bacterium]